MTEILPVICLGLFLLIALWDAISLRIPLTLSFPLLILCSLEAVWRANDFLVLGLAPLGFFFLTFVRWITHGGLGLGDALLSMAMILFLGFYGWLWAIGLACALGIGYGGVMRIRTDASPRLPFAPFLWGGTVVVYFFL